MKTALHSFGYAIDFLAEQVADLSASQMVAQPSGIVNHPAWVIGHLTVTCQELGGALGVEPWLPAEWAKRFGSGSVPVADAEQYESKERLLAMLRDGQARIARAVATLTESQLDQPFPAAEYLDVFPTIRHAITQVLVGHTAYHVGQVNLWRRVMGLPKLKRSFE